MSSESYLIVGLGNPGSKYEETRHNIGFKFLNSLSESRNFKSTGVSFNSQKKFKAETLEGVVNSTNSKKVYLCKPQTYMNNSGESVAAMLKFYKLSIDRIIVAYDDLDLPFGKLRLSQGNSAGGHNGIKSLEQHLSSKAFIKLRLGIGRPGDDNPGRAGMPVDSWVLSKFSAENFNEMSGFFDQAERALISLLGEGLLVTQNKFN